MNRVRQLMIAAPIAAAIVLAGCTGTTGDLAAGTATSMQQSIELIAERAAASDIAGALAELDALQVRLEQARSAGTIGAERAERVQQRIDLVRADLQTLAAQPTPTMTPVPTDAPEEEAPPPAPSESSPPAAPSPTPTPTSEAPPSPDPEPEPEPEPEPSPEETAPEPSPSTSPSEGGGEGPDGGGGENSGDDSSDGDG